MESHSIHSLNSSIFNTSLDDPLRLLEPDTTSSSKQQTPVKSLGKISKRKHRAENSKNAKRPKVLLKTHFNFIKMEECCDDKKTQWSWERSDIIV